MMKKRLITLIAALSLAGVISAADNKSVPHVFSSGTTISSSQMNENFEFVANVFRKTTVDCNNGETIADAINNGYNHITISGTCYGPIHVYALDLIPFGITTTDMGNKPISRLVIKGSEPSRGAKILPGSGMNTMVTSNGMLQLYNLTLTDRLNVGDNSMAYLNEVSYDSTEYRLSAYGNSYMYINSSDVLGEIQAGEASVITIKNSTVQGHQDNEYAAISSDRNSHIETESSLINGGVSVWSGSTYHDDSSQIDCSNLNYKSCVYGTHNSLIDLNSTTINSGSNTGLEVQWNSVAHIFDTPITRGDNGSHIHLNAMSSLQIGGNSAYSMVVDCGSNVYIQDQTSADYLTSSDGMPESCGGYLNQN
jgi:hypothetical protein